MDESREAKDTQKQPGRRKLLIFAILVIALLSAYFMTADAWSLAELAERESLLRRYQAEHPWLVYAVAFGFYVLVTGASLPGAAALSLVYGWYFGLIPGVILVSFASTLGATIAFLVSRFLLREWFQTRFADQVERWNENLDRDGALYLFTLRLIPAVPFFVINVVMGLTTISTWTFWWVSQLGMLPGTFVYLYAGSSLPSLETLSERGVPSVFTPRVVVAFAILGLFPWAVRSAMRRRHDKSTSGAIDRRVR